MGTIKIDINVNVNLSNDVKAFIASLLKSEENKPLMRAVATDSSGLSQESVAEAVAKKTVATEKETTQTAPVMSSITIEDVRKVLQVKVNEHRQTIKDKLNELGAPSVTKLDSSKYKEMFDFLNSL